MKENLSARNRILEFSFAEQGIDLGMKSESLKKPEYAWSTALELADATAR